jgi:phosphoribosylformylglycinamidine synthase
MIARTCTLEDAVKRIERGMVIAATFDRTLDGDEIPTRDHLYDRMTQTISRSFPSLDAIFGQSEPAQATTISFEEYTSAHAALDHAPNSILLLKKSSRLSSIAGSVVEYVT